MLKKGILNPSLNHLLSRVRHTNMLVIADRGFPFWPMIETIDISLVDGVPTVLQVLAAVSDHAVFGKAYMAQEFLENNTPETVSAFGKAFEGVTLKHEPHEAVFKKRISGAIGIVRTGDTTQYSNIVLVSA
jgi:D-ribose pyranase